VLSSRSTTAVRSAVARSPLSWRSCCGLGNQRASGDPTGCWLRRQDRSPVALAEATACFIERWKRVDGGRRLVLCVLAAAPWPRPRYRRERKSTDESSPTVPALNAIPGDAKLDPARRSRGADGFSTRNCWGGLRPGVTDARRVQRVGLDWGEQNHGPTGVRYPAEP